PDIEIKQGCVHIVHIAQSHKLHAFLHIPEHSGDLIAFFRPTAYFEVTEGTCVSAGVDLDVQDALRIAGAVARNIGHIAIIIYNLDFFNDVCRQVSGSGLDIPAEEVFSIDPDTGNG